MGSGTRAIALLAVALLSVGCEEPLRRSPSGRAATVEPLVWPQPPMRPRIRFVRVVANPADLGFKPSLWRRLGEVIVGRNEGWFVRPNGVAASGQRIYVADPGAQAMWVLDASTGRFRRIGTAGGERLISPVAVALGRNGRIYLADSFLARVYVYGAEGKLRGTIEDPNLRRPAGLAYDAPRDRLYVADSASHKVWVFTGEGRRVGAIGRRGNGNGEFNYPTHLAVDKKGTLYVTDSLGFRVQFFSPEGRFVGLFGRHGDTSGDFAMPKGVAVDSAGHIYVVEALFDAVHIFDRRGRYLLAFGERGVGPGQFWLPGGLFIDAENRIYVADAYNQRIQIFEYLSGGSDE